MAKPAKSKIQLVQTPVTTNREQVETALLALAFPTEKAGTLIPVEGISTTNGTVTYSAIRKHLRDTKPDLKGAELTTEVNRLMHGHDAVALHTVLELNRNGFKFQRVAGRELKSGTQTVSIRMSNAADKGNKTKATKAEDLTLDELEALLAKRKAELSARIPVDVQATVEDAPAPRFDTEAVSA